MSVEHPLSIYVYRLGWLRMSPGLASLFPLNGWEWRLPSDCRPPPNGLGIGPGPILPRLDLSSPDFLAPCALVRQEDGVFTKEDWQIRVRRGLIGRGLAS